MKRRKLFPFVSDQLLSSCGSWRSISITPSKIPLSFATLFSISMGSVYEFGYMRTFSHVTRRFVRSKLNGFVSLRFMICLVNIPCLM